MAEAAGTGTRHPPPTMAPVDAIESQPDELRCCCGKDDCVFLRHNCAVLSSVERDVHAAAKMGQALLARHEAYMASAERDRQELTARIEQLERDNADLEAKNKRVTDENHVLREELDQVNGTIKDAETKMAFLETTLRDSQQEVRRLEHAAERAASLERQIAVLEEEQLVLQTNIVRTQEEAKTAMHRWRQAEKGLNDLQEQLERMEKEAREERERHVEMVGRMERQRVMEKELYTAAGRLKGAAGLKSMTGSRGTGNVVSHFVRDLLQDNANLQVAIAELREMLLSSNDEIQMLREQLMYHQPAADHEPGPDSTLQAELANKESPMGPQQPRVSQELHIHHHYHVIHKPEGKKPKRRRQGLTPGTFTPPHISSPGTPITSPVRWQGVTLSPLATPSSVPNLGPLAVHSPNRSEVDMSSAPSSPHSTNRNSLFDRPGDLPSPTSPTTSVDPSSPTWKNPHGKRISEFSLRGISETAQFPAAPPHSQPRPPSQYRSRPHQLDNETTISPVLEHFGPDSPQHSRPHRRVRRALSHESIISLSNGLDIHTLKARPSQLALRPLGLTAAGTGLSAVVALPTMIGANGGVEGRRGSVMLRDSIGVGTRESSGVQTRDGGRGGGGSLGIGKFGTWRGRSAVRGRGGRTVSSPIRGEHAEDDDERRDAERDTGKERERSSSKAPLRLGKLVSWRPWGGNGNARGGGDEAVSAEGDDRDGGAAASPEASPSSTPALAASPPAAPTSTTAPTPALPDDVSCSPTSTLTTTRSAVSASVPSQRPSRQSSALPTPVATPSLASVFRAPGINQPGAVPGFQEYWAAKQRRGAPSKVTVDGGDDGQPREAVVDGLREALREGLGDGAGG
ncbi:hypothetical protein VTK26DRAFT_525 [Humicola hyalothermophila]